MENIISLLLLMALMLMPAAFAEEADVVAYGRIYTSNEDQPWAEAMAIQDGKFVYVGDSAGAESYIVIWLATWLSALSAM